MIEESSFLDNKELISWAGSHIKVPQGLIMIGPSILLDRKLSKATFYSSYLTRICLT